MLEQLPRTADVAEEEKEDREDMDGGNILKLEMYNLNAMPTVGTCPHSLPFLSFILLLINS